MLNSATVNCHLRNHRVLPWSMRHNDRNHVFTVNTCTITYSVDAHTIAVMIHSQPTVSLSLSLFLSFSLSLS